MKMSTKPAPRGYSHESIHISNFLASYCAAGNEMQAFSTKVVQEKDKKLKEFSFKLLHCSGASVHTSLITRTPKCEETGYNV